jgi:nitroimidazol reductase NimA-like FMN-containing flavoprotein (pyridoxamine 5'-phosphate oxidase superfamily)
MDGAGGRDGGPVLSPVRSLEVLSFADAVCLLASAQVGRVVFIAAALPTVVPVTFAVHDGAVVLRTNVDTRLAAAAAGSVLSLQADDVDPAAQTGWSVLVSGLSELVDDPRERAVIRGLVDPWAPGQHEVYVRIPLTVVTGRRIAQD